MNLSTSRGIGISKCGPEEGGGGGPPGAVGRIGAVGGPPGAARPPGAVGLVGAGGGPPGSPNRPLEPKWEGGHQDPPDRPQELEMHHRDHLEEGIPNGEGARKINHPQKSPSPSNPWKCNLCPGGQRMNVIGKTPGLSSQPWSWRKTSAPLGNPHPKGDRALMSALMRMTTIG